MVDVVALGAELGLASGRLHGALDRMLRATHGISATDLMLLRALGGGPLRRGELAEAVGMTASGVSRALRPLEQLLLVESRRDPRDARASQVALTDAGRQRLDDAVQAAAQQAGALLGGLYPDEAAGLLRLLGRLSSGGRSPGR